MLIDGHNLLFRMFYGIPGPIYNTNNQDIRAVVGFVGGVTKAIKEFSADELIIVFDSESSTSDRVEIDEDYKSNRVDYSQVAEEENPFTQLPMIYQVLDTMGIDYLEATTCEADDYIASLSKYYHDKEVIIMSTDRDFLQLVSNRIMVYSPRGKMSIEFDADKVFEKFSVEPKQIIDYKILVGDKSDNIEGVKSIGPKTAVKILAEGSLDFILTGKSNLADKLYKKLEDARGVIEKNRLLITMDQDIPIERDHGLRFIEEVYDRGPMAYIKDAGLY